MKLALTYNVKKEQVGDTPAVSDDHYAEWDDMETIEGVKSALLARHDTVELIEADEEAYEKIRKVKPELVFNMAEGFGGDCRESHIPAILEMLGVPYTGSAPLTLALCLNKARAKQVMSCCSIPTPAFIVAENAQDALSEVRSGSLKLPLMVKPLFEGSSKGVRDNSFVQTEAELAELVEFVNGEYGQAAIVEEYLEGREFTVALIGNDGRGNDGGGNDGRLRALPPVEINYSSLPAGVNHIYSYEAKWILDTPDKPLDIFTCPAEMDDELAKDVEGAAMGAFRSLSVRDWCRVDVRLDSDGIANIIELNPLPGILPDPEQNSCFPKAARAAGMDFTELVNSVVDVARRRYGI